MRKKSFVSFQKIFMNTTKIQNHTNLRNTVREIVCVSICIWLCVKVIFFYFQKFHHEVQHYSRLPTCVVSVGNEFCTYIQKKQ